MVEREGGGEDVGCEKKKDFDTNGNIHTDIDDLH